MNSYHHYLHQRALKIAAEFRKTESGLLEILQKIDKQRVYLQLGYNSLFVYATQALKLSEAVAYSFIQVARKAKEVPELKLAINQGELTISKAQRIVSVITPENKAEILIMAKTLPKQQLEKQVARLNPKQIVPEKTRYVTAERLELKLGVSEALMQQIRRVQDLLSSQRRQAVSLEEALSGMATEYLERHDPLEKARRAQKRLDHTPSATLCPGRVPVGESYAHPTIVGLGVHNSLSDNIPNKAGIPAEVRHEIMLKDQAQCTHVDDNGQRCQQQRWLHVHHKTPKAYGGQHHADNLTLLCAGHHQAVHRAG